MKKILVQIEKDYISFSLSYDINLEDYNKTNIFSNKKLKFSDNFILENLDTVGNLFNILTTNLKINKVVIEDVSIADTILKLLQYIKNINMIYFKEDKQLDYSLCSLMLENKYLYFINCYSMPEYVFDRFNTLKKVKVKLRYEIFSISKFMEENNMKTYSDMYYQKIIKLNKIMQKEDIEDLLAFLKINNHLKVVNISDYCYENLVIILNTLKKYHKDNMLIVINQNKNDDLLNSIDDFKDLEDKYNVRIKVNYDEEYKIKNRFKQLNLNVIKAIVLIALFISISITILYFILNKKEEEKIDSITETVNESINEILNENTDDNEEESEYDNNLNNNHFGKSYYTKYEEVFDKLLEINKDTVGWIKVNNTKVNYPVVQTSDNDYYLKHAFDNEKNLAGWIFVDYRNKLDDKNVIIYGHSIKKGELMFGSLRHTIEESWYKNSDNQIITFNTRNGNNKYQIFSIYTVEDTDNYLITNFSSNDSFREYINKSLERSIYDFKVDINDDDKIITLSTCHKDDKHRLVIQAKKI